MSIRETVAASGVLSDEEKALHARALSAVDAALRRHGVSLSGAELRHVSAELADFVTEEVSRTAEAEVVDEAEPPKRKKKD